MKKKNRKETTKLPLKLETELDSMKTSFNDPRFKFKGYSGLFDRKNKRKENRITKKQTKHLHNSKKLNKSDSNPVQCIELGLIKESGNVIVSKIKQKQGKLPVKTELTEQQKLDKLKLINPVLHARILANSHSHLDNSHDDEMIQYYSKKLGIKNGKIPKSFQEDGLDDLFDGLDGIDKSQQDNGEDDEEDQGEDYLMNDKEVEDEKGGDNSPISDNEESEESDSDNQIQELDSLDSEDDVEMDDYNSIEEIEEMDDSENENENESEKEQADNEPSIQITAPLIQGTKYIPPHMRNSTPPNETNLRLSKQMQGFLNKLSDSNIEKIINSFEELFQNVSRHAFTSTLIDLILQATSDSKLQLSDSFSLLHAAFSYCIMQFVGNEFGANLIQNIIERFDENRKKTLKSNDEETTKIGTNMITLLSHLFNFNILSPILIYDIIRQCIGSGLLESDVEILLRLLRISGQQLRQLDPLSFKEVVHAVKEATPSVNTLSSRCKFMIETITELKNNKKSKVVDKRADRLKKFVGNFSKKRARPFEPFRVSLDDIRQADTKGKWWMVGAAWTGPVEQQISNHDLPKDLSKSQTLDSNILKLAKQQGMNTEIRKSIFIVLMTSEDYIDAYERLMKLGLKDKQEREIIKVIIHCCQSEKVYNPYYALIGKKLCEFNYSFKITTQFCIWDVLKEMNHETPDHKIESIAIYLSDLICHDAMSFSVLKILDFTQLNPEQTKFNQQLFISCFESGVGCEELFGSIKRMGLEELVEGILFFIRQCVHDAILNIQDLERRKKLLKMYKTTLEYLVEEAE